MLEWQEWADAELGMISKLEENIKILDEGTRKCTSLANEIDSSMRELESRLNSLIITARDDEKPKKFKDALESQARDIAWDINTLERRIQNLESDTS